MTAYASTVTIRITPRHGAVLVGVLSGFPQRREGGEISVHVPDMYLQEHKDLLVDFRLPACPLEVSSSDEGATAPLFGCLPMPLCRHRSQMSNGVHQKILFLLRPSALPFMACQTAFGMHCLQLVAARTPDGPSCRMFV